jgi:membrane protein DedA with SNARE-associated domain
LPLHANALLEMLPPFISHYPLPCAFAFLLVFGFTTPICEEIALALVGATIRATGTSLLTAIALALVALLLQDSAGFHIGRAFGARIIRHRFLARLFKPRGIEAAERYLAQRGSVVVFASRFVVGMRAAAIYGSGLLGMRWRSFILYDSLAAAIMVPAWLLAGYALGARLDSEAGRLSALLGIVAPAAALIGAILVFRGVRADRVRAEAGATRALPAPDPSGA